VLVSVEAFLVCMSHALTTEKEEVMGLLLGDIKKTARGSVAFVWQVAVLRRSDKRKDRVEIEPAQLTAAAAEAERLSAQMARKVRVIGWYHSHPHITVHPSHVDVRTQAMYQMMDSGFIGLIFSCFNYDAELNGRIQVIAFQSLDLSRFSSEEERKASAHSYEQINIPLTIVPAEVNSPNTLLKLVELQRIISQEDRASYTESLKGATSDKVHPLMEMYSGGVYQKSMCRLLEYGCQPLLRLLKDRQEQNMGKLADLQAERARMLG